jgi:PEP-CTERM motif
MLRRFVPLAAAIWACSAGAAPVPFTGFVELHIGVQVAHLDLAGDAEVSAAGGVTLPDGAGATTGAVVPIRASVAPTAAPIVGLQFTMHNGRGSFAFDGASHLGGVMPVLGVVKVCLFLTCPSAVANVSVPLSAFGRGGTSTAMGVVNVTVAGAPWTTAATETGSLLRGADTAMGFRRGPAGAESSYARPGGALQLVTPIFISTFIGVTPAFGVLHVDFVPEPATLSLCAAGIAVLGNAARRRRARS